MKGLPLSLIATTVLLAACGQAPSRNIQDQTSEVQNATRTAQVQRLLPASVQGTARQRLRDFLNSQPGDLSHIKDVILIDGDPGLAAQSADSQVTFYSNRPGVEVQPFQKPGTAEPPASAGTPLSALNLALCPPSGGDASGYFSKRAARNYYGGFASKVILPYNVSQAPGDTAYIYGSISTLDGSQAAEIGLQYSKTSDTFNAYMSIQGRRPNASSSSTNYDQNGYLMPVLRFTRGYTFDFIFYDVTDVNISSTFYIVATFNTTLVGYRYQSGQTSLVPGLQPKEYLGYAQRYSGMQVSAMNTMASNFYSGVPASFSYGGQFTAMRLMVPTPVTYNFDDPMWDASRSALTCVNNTSVVNASLPAPDAIYTNIYKPAR